jgi:hypothetical protein
MTEMQTITAFLLRTIPYQAVRDNKNCVGIWKWGPAAKGVLL